MLLLLNDYIFIADVSNMLEQNVSSGFFDRFLVKTISCVENVILLPEPKLLAHNAIE